MECTHIHPLKKKQTSNNVSQLIVVPLLTWSNGTKASYDIADMHQTNVEPIELI